MAEVPPYDPEASGPAYIYVLIADHLQARIEAGDWQPGEKLPGLTALMEAYGDVASNTMRRAIGELRRRGLVVVLPAKGTYVVRRDRG